MTRFNHEDDVVDKTVDAVMSCVVVRVPDSFYSRLNALFATAKNICVPRMLHIREASSSRFYPELPCVVAKSLITKYQNNKKCMSVDRPVLPVCGDKGKQIKIVDGGVRIPALFKKDILPVKFPKTVVGHVRNAEFLYRGGRWFCSLCYMTPADKQIAVTGTIGIDRNAVGNVAVLADPQNGKVLHLGFNPSATKENFRNRRRNLKLAGNRRALRALRRKQSRQTIYENHVVSKQVVSYAVKHRRAIVVENLETVRKGKIRSFVNTSQWAFYQLLRFLRYKAALRGIPVLSVDPAYTSQECSRCGQRNTPNGEKYVCAGCGHKDHRDANAAFNVGSRVCYLSERVSVELAADSERGSRAVLVPPYLEAAYVE